MLTWNVTSLLGGTHVGQNSALFPTTVCTQVPEELHGGQGGPARPETGGPSLARLSNACTWRGRHSKNASKTCPQDTAQPHTSTRRQVQQDGSRCPKRTTARGGKECTRNPGTSTTARGNTDCFCHKLIGVTNNRKKSQNHFPNPTAPTAPQKRESGITVSQNNNLSRFHARHERRTWVGQRVVCPPLWCVAFGVSAETCFRMENKFTELTFQVPFGSMKSKIKNLILQIRTEDTATRAACGSDGSCGRLGRRTGSCESPR